MQWYEILLTYNFHATHNHLTSILAKAIINSMVLKDNNEILTCPFCNFECLCWCPEVMNTTELICSGCSRSFSSLLGIVDFRDTEIDRTEAFSIAADRLVAYQLSIVFDKVTTFNELYDVYKLLINRSFHEVNTNLDIIEQLHIKYKSSQKYLSDSQLAHGKAILEKIKNYVSEINHHMPSNSIALENGCGLGLFIDGFSAHFKKLVVLDFSLSYLILAKKIVEERMLDNVTLVCGSVERLPFKAQTFDFIHSNNVIEHVSNQKALFAEAKRVLKPKALFFVMSPNRFSAYYEPHFRIPFYGFIPKLIRRKIIWIWQHRNVDDISLLSLSELRAMASDQFGENIYVSFIPRYLTKSVTGGYIRDFLVRSLNSNILGPLANLLINRLFLGLMPYHVVLCFKK